MLHNDIAETFKEYIFSLKFDELQDLNEDLNGNGGGLLLIEDYENSVELLKSFDIFYRWRFPYTMGILPIPDGNVPSFLKNKKNINKKTMNFFKGHMLMA